jgi:hypothetical protein
MLNQLLTSIYPKELAKKLKERLINENLKNLFILIEVYFTEI